MEKCEVVHKNSKTKTSAFSSLYQEPELLALMKNIVEEHCHPERSEGSMFQRRSFVSLRMTGKIVGEMVPFADAKSVRILSKKMIKLLMTI